MGIAVKHDEGSLDRLPVGWETGRGGRRIVRPGAAGERIEPRVIRRKFSRSTIQLSHFDAAPKTAEREPRFSLGVEYEVWIDGIEIVGSFGLDHQSAILPVILRTLLIERLIGQESDAGSVYAKCGVGVIKMKQAVEIRNIGGPEIPCLWTRLLNPVGNCGQYITAALPPM